MDNARSEILLALREDRNESDGFCCFEILEPYVNANRKNKLSDRVVCELVVELVSEKLICAFDRLKINRMEKWCPTEVNIWNAKDKWYRINTNESNAKDI